MPTPIGEFVMCETPSNEEVSEFGIIIARDKNKEPGKCRVAKILGVGDGVELPIKVGDIAVFNPYDSYDVEHSGGRYTFVAAKLVYGVIHA